VQDNSSRKISVWQYIIPIFDPDVKNWSAEAAIIALDDFFVAVSRVSGAFFGFLRSG
jgi:hypothetical protein